MIRFFCRLLPLIVCSSLPALSVVVTHTGDSGVGSLRQCIETANAAGSTTITFNIPQSDANHFDGTYFIRPATPLPALENGTIIDGSTQPNMGGSLGPGVILDGLVLQAGNSNASGLTIEGDSCIVRHLTIQSFPGAGIVINGAQNVVTACHIGTNANGTPIDAGNGDSGIYLGGDDNLIGGSEFAERNLISGNQRSGITVHGSRNSLLGNYIGVGRTGNGSVPNQGDGIDLFLAGANHTQIGGPGIFEGNVISGNRGSGISIRQAQHCKIQGNIIGLAASGSSDIPNQNDGINLSPQCNDLTIGGPLPEMGNVISGNERYGIIAHDNRRMRVQNNIIGLNGIADRPEPNGSGGMFLAFTLGAIISDNVVSGNQGHGIELSAGGVPNAGQIPDQECLLTGNLVGLAGNGQRAVTNAGSGLTLSGGSSGNQIGGTTESARNYFSGNANFGIEINGTAAPGSDGPPARNVIEGNWIGLPVSGDADTRNGWSRQGNTADSDIAGGIGIFAGLNNRIGGSAPGAGNVISGNAFHGIFLNGPDVALNRVEGNLIGLAPDGITAKGNLKRNTFFFDGAGINIWNGAHDNVIGGTTPGSGNIIASNGASGITLSGLGTDRNLIYGNTIGTNAQFLILGNGFTGITFLQGASNNRVGGIAPGTSNTIANNGLSAISVHHDTTHGNLFRGNSIHDNNQSGFAWATIDLIPRVQGQDVRGPTPNDPLDADLGPHQLVNRPIMGPIEATADGTKISCAIVSTPNTLFRVEFFASPPSPMPGPDARHFIGAYTNPAGAPNGQFTFELTVPVYIPGDWLITAIASNDTTGSSELADPSSVIFPDTDNDGMPTPYETRHGLDTLRDDANEDIDGDRITNIDEMRLGTNPRQYSEGLTLEVTDGSGIQFPSQGNRVYRLEASDSPSGPWTVLLREIQGTGAPIEVTDPTASSRTRRFYQLVQTP